ncbi:tRNA pseudouridine(55) synthase TruB [Lachnoclostridium phytofermentans]|uniref:tRNA pseudouridine synthase B n=1 Tax=Lachnoclostridium phytofermentans (strain ATCC 700394 / DSM 18823 / ISDg) TaxID=357809 RepID=TRUB_LACP7|nr:tRNA pseudouridine(55) synthase TruB [Lachnoclostridium phytofermentans]A9KNW1.1 RecName: Full=tRNA pseudouridine synthase B; AltName: Full=tRNA pseudouridine(55) synthase; Short=Psi55 synthase; AltName: Full=tRNA pseudouridylate synthase; AltName: Full=tRNA-uridine isomerase [Lachnoclostridium phytofermentans ISDg]ABX43131.1 tRNA pseudouridine synthase B [Lachnoclostridium phytofermentans ISDg]
MNGIINVYKEKGFTSFDVCAKLRGILKQKKIGHTGTLDPDAEGVLPVCVGNATKLCDLLTDKDKVYEAVLTLGIITDTEDMTGEVLERRLVTATYDRVLEVVEQFTRTYDQIPPMYSAIKVNGQKLYELARQGKVIERKPRTVTIHAIDILGVTPLEEQPEIVHEVRMRVSCSKGTYIRSLCRDIGEALQCGGCMKSLIRTQVSIFTLENTLRLAEIEECVKNQTLEQVLMPVDKLFLSMPKVVVKKESCKFLYNGNQLVEDNFTWEKVSDQINIDKIRVYDSEDVFTGIYEYDEKKNCYQPVKMFL